jgi:prophage maintenance system killer protein
VSEVNPNAQPGGPSLFYLTVQDILWINTQITKQVNRFDYNKLEEGVFYQYGYGQSQDLNRQAAAFFAGFAKNQPFEAGNEPTAFIAGMAFLKINGKILDLTDDEALSWFNSLRAAQRPGGDVIGGRIQEDSEFHEALKPEVQPAVQTVLARYPKTVAALAGAQEPPAVASA